MSPSVPPAKKTIVVNPYKTNKKVAVPVASTAKSTMLFPKFAPALNVNPYKKKKTFDIFVPSKQNSGMVKITNNKKDKDNQKALWKKTVTVHDYRQTGVGKGCLVSTSNGNTIWSLLDGAVLVPVIVLGAIHHWKVVYGVQSLYSTTVGKIDLKKMLIELHLMGFWSGLSQSGTHHSCSDNKKAFRETMDVLNNVIHRDKLLTEESLINEKDWIGYFVMKQATPEEIETEEFNRKWDRIVQMIKDRVVSCKIGGETMTDRPVGNTPFSIGARVITYKAAVKRATKQQGLYINLNEKVEWKSNAEKGQQSIFNFVEEKI